MLAKVQNIGLSAQYLVKDDVGEIHIAISANQMGKRHRNARETILRRVLRSHQLRKYTIFLLLNPTCAGKSCTAFVLKPGKANWDSKPAKMLPEEALVA
jgi:hypothetical protein